MKKSKKKRAEATLRRVRKMLGKESDSQRPENLEETQQEATPSVPSESEYKTPTIAQGQEICSALLSISTQAWRAKMKMIGPDGEPREETRKYYRHVEALLEVIGDLGIEINDYTGRRYVDGMDVNVVAFEPIDGANEEEVLETLKPEIRWQGHRLQQAEIIVGSPGKV